MAHAKAHLYYLWFSFIRKGKEKEEKTDTDREETDAKENKAADDKKKKRKIRLDMHLDQVFLDSQVINGYFDSWF